MSYLRIIKREAIIENATVRVSIFRLVDERKLESTNLKIPNNLFSSKCENSEKCEEQLSEIVDFDEVEIANTDKKEVNASDTSRKR